MSLATDEANDAADRWTVRIGGPPLSDAEHAEFQRWLLADASHATAFQDRCTILALASELRSLPEVRHAKWQKTRPAIRTLRFPGGWRAGLAAAAAMAAITLILVIRAGSALSSTYETRIGETRVVRLSDGSTATLDTATRLEWRNGSHERDVNLTAGQALFDVAHDSAKLFVVHVGATQIRVTGTQFNVYRHDREVWVTVIRGIVEVTGPGSTAGPDWHRSVHENEQIMYSGESVVTDVHRISPQHTLKWSAHELDVEDETLGFVVDELSRYTTVPITLQDPSLAQIRIAATFDLSDIPKALEQLQAVARVKLERTRTGYVLSAASEVSKPSAARGSERP